MARATAALVLAILLLIGAGFFLLGTIGLSYGAGSTPADPGLAAFSATCTGILGIVGIVFLVLYRGWSVREARMAALVSLLRPGGEVRIDDLARSIGQSPAETLLWINEAIASGRVIGYIDPGAGTFVGRPPGWGSPAWVPTPPQPTAGTAPPEVSTVPRFCRECGNPIRLIPGEAFYRCLNCGHIEPL